MMLNFSSLNFLSISATTLSATEIATLMFISPITMVQCRTPKSKWFATICAKSVNGFISYGILKTMLLSLNNPQI